MVLSIRNVFTNHIVELYQEIRRDRNAGSFNEL